MKTLAVLFLLATTAIAQTIHDMEKLKVRVQVQVIELMPQGVRCAARKLVRNKLGREVPGESLLPPMLGAPTTVPTQVNLNGVIMRGERQIQSVEPQSLLVLDLDFLPVKAGEVRDLWLYPGRPSFKVPSYFVNASNAALDAQGKQVRVINEARVKSLAFEAVVGVTLDGRMTTLSRKDGSKPLDGQSGDPFATGSGGGFIARLLGSPVPQSGVFYHTATVGTYAVSVQEAMKTYQK